MTEKRGMTATEAMAYVGVRRRTFNEVWRPRLVAQRQGTSLIYDREDLDRLFSEFKREAFQATETAANDTAPAQAHNGPRNGRPTTQKGWMQTWARQRGASTPTKTGPGKSTRSGAVLDFASVASQVLKKPSAG